MTGRARLDTTAKPPSTRRARPWRWLVLVVLGALLLLAATSTWLLRSGGGRDFALARVVAALPPGATLTWRNADGALVGPVVFHDLRYEHAGLVVEVERAVVDLAPGALLGRRLHIEQLTLERGRMQLPPGEESAEPWPRAFTLPESLPELQLPLAVSLDKLALRAIRIEQGELALIELRSVDAIGNFDRGRLELDRLDIISDRGSLHAKGAFDSARRWDTDVEASFDLPGDGASPVPLDLRIAGDLRDLRITATGNVPDPATLTLGVTGGLPDPHWVLTLDAPRVDPRLFGADGEFLALSLRADGTLSTVNVSGRIGRGARTWQVEPSTLRYSDGVVHLQPLELALDAGHVVANGTIDLRGDDPLLAIVGSWRDLVLPTSANDIVTSTGSARLEGPLADYELHVDATLLHAQRAAAITLQGRGGEQRLAIESLQVTMPGGGLQAEGEVAWSPELRWKMDARSRGFDPAYFAPEFPGAVDATITSTGAFVGERLQGEVRIDPLGGTLRGRAVGGRVIANIDADGNGRGEVSLRLGESRIYGEGTWGDRVDARVQLSPLQLPDLLPGSSGRISGSLVLSGTRESPVLVAELDAGALALQGFAARTARLRANLGSEGTGRIALDATEVDIGEQRFDTLALVGEGTRARHALSLALDGSVARARIALEGGEIDGRWRGQLRDLQLEPKDRATWALREPAELAFDRESGELRLAQSCLVAAEASLCAQAQWAPDVGNATFRLDALPLATLDPFLSAAFDLPASAYGVLSADAKIHRNAAGETSGEANLSSPEGGLRLDPESPRELLVYRRLTMHATLDPQRAQLEADAQLAADGNVHAQLELSDPAGTDGVLRGRIDAKLRDLTFLELFSDQIVDPVGSVDVALGIEGSRAAPLLAGGAELSGFGAELPALGLTLRAGELTLRSRGSRAADIRGKVESGGGTLHVQGSYDAATNAEQTLALTLAGENVVAAAIPELSATVSPQIEVALLGDTLRVRGKVAVPTARINLERLQGATTPSTDVVVVDATAPAAGEDSKLDSDVSVEFGEDVRLNGFGLKGKLEGQISMRDRPGRATLARGGVQVSGEYKAYGQDLTITRGRLSYASTPLDDPALDVRAEREIDQITVGVQVRGTALAPELTLWSEPALDQAEQLSYLVLGRPLRSASQADGAQLSQAAAAFGGNLLAQKLGARMGLDEVGVADSRALGGAALTVGKFLSPKLYVSYGVALFGSGQVVTFKYLLSRVWSVQIDSGTENRAALNYRLER